MNEHDVETRKTGAYWYATGRGASHEASWAFSCAHAFDAAQYYAGRLTVLSSIPNAWDAFGKVEGGAR